METPATPEEVHTHKRRSRKSGSPRQVSRSRWAAIGAAVAVSIGAGGIGLTHAISTNGGNVFVPISPCRLFDTRPAPLTVGPRATKIAANETYTQQVTGDNGQCTGIPADATGVAMNVTAVDTTAASYLTIFPADVVTVPNASNLNWIPGAPPTPNKVDVKLSPTGAIKVYNNVGTVNVLADIVGYYQDHNHDDRYLRKQGSIVIGHPAFVAGAAGQTTSFVNGCIQSSNTSALEAAIPLQVGLTITSVKAWVIDASVTGNVTISLNKTTAVVDQLAAATSTGNPGIHTITATLATPELVEPGEYFFVRYNPGIQPGSTDVCGIEITYV